MTTSTSTAERLQLRPSTQASFTAFRALLLRDLQVLRKIQRLSLPNGRVAA